MGCQYCFCNTFDYRSDEGDRTTGFPKGKMTFDTAKEAIEKAINTIKKNNKSYLSIEFFWWRTFAKP
ncbi:hypothetical protein [Paramaledivibacter caminithermalis]|jgi:sulfatase maturation enzyme AslB (radical SAM superfamily)|uniref:hypothetical protein n=1 Tax=Paramaledivibacter caminithermalis TaxID=191027 RepID=UPI0009343F2D|nr:hypothetical protein [Paramaledivibacter caminithermalis]